jgi:IS30 family transposase
MARTGRPGLSDAQKRELWRGWRAGQTLSEIGLALGKHAGSIHGVVAANGGIVPATRSRARNALSPGEREEISRGLATGHSVRRISRALGRAPSTVSREIRRNGGVGRYRAAVADDRAWERGQRPKRCHLARHECLRSIVALKLTLDWSPQQIAGWLALQFPGDDTMQVSHETIYRSLFLQARGVLRKELVKHLRSRRMMRRSAKATTRGQRRGQIIDAVSIRERPADIEDRAIPGHWEGDLVSGAGNTHIATLVERHSRFTMLVKVPGKDTASVVPALSRHVSTLPEALRQSLTWDRGTELAGHKDLSLATDIDVYFCDPQSPWQRGTNENTNGLLRQYFPKGTSLAHITQEELDRVALLLNQRPRKTLGYHTPADILQVTVAPTH